MRAFPALLLSLATLACACRANPAGAYAPPDGAAPDTRRDVERVDGKTAAGPEAVPDGAWRELFDGATLDGWSLTEFGGEGEVAVDDGAIVMEMGMPLTGIHRADADLPRVDYELEVVAARLLGNDFFCALTFPAGPAGEGHASLILGGWGGAVTGISCIDGRDASENETTGYRSFATGVDHVVRLRVTGERIRAWIDGEPLVDVDVAGKRLEVRSEVLPSRPFGLACFQTRARVRAVRIRSL